MKRKLYQILKASKIDPVSAPDMFTALMAKKLAGGGATEHEYTGAVPYTFTANGEPLLDYLISGNMSQTGTPSPTTPIQPSETGEMTGNLFELTDSSATANNIITLVDFGEDVTFDIITCSCVFENLEAEGTYSAFFDYLMNDGTHQYVSLSAMLNVNDDTKVPTNVKVNGNYYNTKQNITFRKIQAYLYATGYNKFKSGSIKWAFYDSGKKDFEPYGYKLPISSANTTTPVYLGEVETTRRIKKLVLTGEEDIDTVEVSGTNLFRVPINYTRDKIQEAANTSMRCNAYPIATNRGTCASTNNTMSTFNTTNDLRIIIHNDTYTTADEFKAYLAQQYANGTPVCVWYVLATPQTAVVNEPLRKIGEYADTLSMEQGGVNIPTNNGSTTIDVETAVKPSEVYIKYKG